MSHQFQSLFITLRDLLRQHAAGFTVSSDTATRYCLEGTPGPATLRAWRGKLKRPSIPVAWVEIGKAYVAYHLMGMDGNARLHDAMSRELKGRMQGKTCFNFSREDPALFKELEQVTARALRSFSDAGFVTPAQSG